VVVDVQRVRPKIVDEIEAKPAVPPQRHVLCVVGEADRPNEQIARNRHRTWVTGLEREVEESERATDGGV
jgi:hypothetical protein